MSEKYVTLQITCCHEECGKAFHLRPEVTSNAQGETDQVVDCPHCGKPNNIRIPKEVAPKPGMMVRGLKLD